MGNRFGASRSLQFMARRNALRDTGLRGQAWLDHSRKNTASGTRHNCDSHTEESLLQALHPLTGVFDLALYAICARFELIEDLLL